MIYYAWQPNRLVEARSNYGGEHHDHETRRESQATD